MRIKFKVIVYFSMSCQLINNLRKVKMKSALYISAGILTILSHVLMSSAQNQGGWANGNSAGSWASSNSHPGQPFSNDPQNQSQFSYGYGGVDANGVPYGGSGGNGGYHINVSDERGRQHTYSGGQQGGYPGAPGQPGQPGQPGYPGTFSYANSNSNRNYDPYSGRSSSSSSFSTAWSTFYVICLFSLFLIIKS